MIDGQDINLLRKQQNFQNPEPPSSRRKWRLFLLLGVIVLILAGGIVLATHGNTNSLEYDPVTLEPKTPDGFFKKLSYLVFKKETDLQGQKKDRINILLLGIGGLEHDGPFLTDTIIIASIQPSTNEVALISIPRDLGVDIKGKGTYKINSASAFGEVEKAGWGGAYATEVISNTFGIDIPYYIRLDFTAFKEIIDEVGGVRIEVPRTFTDTQYPGPQDSYQTITFNVGVQTMDGETALTYARSRHGNNGEGSDFARARRQQQILLALKQKILSFNTLTNPLRIKKIMDALEKNMTTNMQFDEIIELVRMGRELNTKNIKTLVLDDSPAGFLVNASTPGGAFILSPKTGKFDEIDNAIKNIFASNSIQSIPTTSVETTPSESPREQKTEVSVEIQNGTWSAGLAAQAEERLKTVELYTNRIGNVQPENKPIASSGVYILDPHVESTGKKIANELNIPLYPTLPSGVTPLASSTNIVVVLGDDYTH